MQGLLNLLDAMRQGNGDITLTLVVWAIILGIIVSWVIAFCNQKITGTLVSALISAGATSEENAKTLSEIGQEYNVSAVSKYKSSAAVRRIVCSVPETKQITEETRLYIPEDKLPQASRLYGGKETSVWMLLIGAIALMAVGIVVSLIAA